MASLDCSTWSASSRFFSSLRRQDAERLDAATKDHQGHPERQPGPEQEDAELLPEAAPELVDGHRGVEPQRDGTVLFPADDDRLRILECRQVEPVDEPARGLRGDLRPEGRDGMTGIVGPRESG